MRKILILCVSVLSVVACSKNSGGSASLTEEVPSTPGSTLTVGTYSTGCMSSGPVSSSSDLVVTADYLEFTNIIYEDGSCAQPRTKYYHKNSYTDVGASSVQAGARNINMSEGKLFYTPMSAAAVNDFNNHWTQCGFTDWVLNQEKDVSATSCQETALGAVTYTIIKTASAQLLLGEPDWNDPASGTTSNTRVVDFSSAVFNKQ